MNLSTKSNNLFYPFLTVDPGFNTGIAYWTRESCKEKRPEDVYGWAAPKVGNIFERVQHLWKEFEEHLNILKPQLVIIEDQWFNSASFKSVTSSSSGAMKKLTWVVGGYIHVVLDMSRRCNMNCRLVEPIHWKGNMNDYAVRCRVEMIAGSCNKSAHINDAVGIGLDALGLFKKVGQ